MAVAAVNPATAEVGKIKLGTATAMVLLATATTRLLEIKVTIIVIEVVTPLEKVYVSLLGQQIYHKLYQVCSQTFKVIFNNYVLTIIISPYI